MYADSYICNHANQIVTASKPWNLWTNWFRPLLRCVWRACSCDTSAENFFFVFVCFCFWGQSDETQIILIPPSEVNHHPSAAAWACTSAGGRAPRWAQTPQRNGTQLLNERHSNFRVLSPFLWRSSYTQEFFNMHAALMSTCDDALLSTCWF